MYDVVLLDADGTLFDYELAAKTALSDTFLEFGLDYVESAHLKAYRSINDGLWLMLENGEIDAITLRSERFRLLFERFGICLHPETFDQKYLRHLSRTRFLIEGAEKACKCLAKKARLAVLTNGIKQVQMKRIGQSRLNRYLERIIVSEDAGYQKPHPGIFAYALKAMNHLDRSSVLMVGDSQSADIKGGQDFGIDTCWFNPAKARPSPGLNPTYVVDSLECLCDIF